MSALFEPGRNCWQLARTDRLSVIIDAADYFTAAREAMMRAQSSIMMVGWDFDARIRFDAPEHNDDAPEHLGQFMLWLANRTPDLQIRMLQWNSGMMKNWLRGANAYYLCRWKWHSQITARFDGIHPPGGSHHQKLLVIDDSLAFCGGIDMTVKRWDTRNHLDDEPNRVSPSGRALEPWHDCAAMCDADAARALGQVARRRWKRATGEDLPAIKGKPLEWPSIIKPLFGPAEIAIARSRPKMEGQDPIREIEALYIDMIATARHVIYAESQYFASRRIASALARRLEEPDGPEVVIINPYSADGWLEPIAMDTARARLFEALRRHDRYNRLAIYHPVTAGRNPIYVHAKVMIVDDRLMRIGSSNFNNRSMRLDSECDVAIDALQDETGGMAAQLQQLRHDLLAEHLGFSIDEVRAAAEREGTLIGGIEALRRDEGRSLVRYEVPDLSVIETWLADNEILDPDGPEEMFELVNRRGLFRGRLRRPK
ncbi:phospholipase D-like domain-containing protein [Falsirhodobacter sp. alg1]|uniref:phospholipase D-like domain-containing protein n=1 Tax=Falsirhodobacter sp. alg1 TaxID=1472418 RepID=UPI0005EE578F|nr:phospholipase D-like domain-containing protein [Falsirhodobacter sp. alg1]